MISRFRTIRKIDIIYIFYGVWRNLFSRNSIHIEQIRLRLFAIASNIHDFIFIIGINTCCIMDLMKFWTFLERSRVWNGIKFRARKTIWFAFNFRQKQNTELNTYLCEAMWIEITIHSESSTKYMLVKLSSVDLCSRQLNKQKYE